MCDGRSRIFETLIKPLSKCGVNWGKLRKQFEWILFNHTAKSKPKHSSHVQQQEEVSAKCGTFFPNQLKKPWFDLQLDALNSCLYTYNTFIKHLYMFRALTLLFIRRSTS
jgi:hypothetical protein